MCAEDFEWLKLKIIHYSIKFLLIFTLYQYNILETRGRHSVHVKCHYCWCLKLVLLRKSKVIKVHQVNLLSLINLILLLLGFNNLLFKDILIDISGILWSLDLWPYCRLDLFILNLLPVNIREKGMRFDALNTAHLLRTEPEQRIFLKKAIKECFQVLSEPIRRLVFKLQNIP